MHLGIYKIFDIVSPVREMIQLNKEKKKDKEVSPEKINLENNPKETFYIKVNKELKHSIEHKEY